MLPISNSEYVLLGVLLQFGFAGLLVIIFSKEINDFYFGLKFKNFFKKSNLSEGFYFINFLKRLEKSGYDRLSFSLEITKPLLFCFRISLYSTKKRGIVSNFYKDYFLFLNSLSIDELGQVVKALHFVQKSIETIENNQDSSQNKNSFKDSIVL